MKFLGKTKLLRFIIPNDGVRQNRCNECSSSQRSRKRISYSFSPLIVLFYQRTFVTLSLEDRKTIKKLLHRLSREIDTIQSRLKECSEMVMAISLRKHEDGFNLIFNSIEEMGKISEQLLKISYLRENEDLKEKLTKTTEDLSLVFHNLLSQGRIEKNKISSLESDLEILSNAIPEMERNLLELESKIKSIGKFLRRKPRGQQQTLVIFLF